MPKALHGNLRSLVAAAPMREVMNCKCGGTYEAGRYAWHCRFSKSPLHANDKRTPSR